MRELSNVSAFIYLIYPSPDDVVSDDQLWNWFIAYMVYTIWLYKSISNKLCQLVITITVIWIWKAYFGLMTSRRFVRFANELHNY